MMDLVLSVTAVILSLAAAGAIVRIAVGPSLLDRVLAADVLLAIFGAALCIDMAVEPAPEQPDAGGGHLHHRLHRVRDRGPFRGGPAGGNA